MHSIVRRARIGLSGVGYIAAGLARILAAQPERYVGCFHRTENIVR